MKKDASSPILSRINRRDGMTVPEGYFDTFADDMLARLPQRPELDLDAAAAAALTTPRTLWQRIRPYAYMAAMFAGVWCMLKMFSLMSDQSSLTPIDDNPIIAEAFSNDTFVNDYVINDLDDQDLYDELMASGIDAETLCDSLAYIDSIENTSMSEISPTQ